MRARASESDRDERSNFKYINMKIGKDLDLSFSTGTFTRSVFFDSKYGVDKEFL